VLNQSVFRLFVSCFGAQHVLNQRKQCSHSPAVAQKMPGILPCAAMAPKGSVLKRPASGGQLHQQLATWFITCCTACHVRSFGTCFESIGRSC
jgi:hypothetical protein